MIKLREIFTQFSTNEKKEFVKYLNDQNKRKDTKNIDLFKLLINHEIPENIIHEQLYENKSKGAYHALRKRLTESLINFSVHQNKIDNKSGRNGWRRRHDCCNNWSVSWRNIWI